MMTNPETEREAALASIDAGVRRLQECVLKALILTPVIEWQTMLDKVAHQLDELLGNMAAAQSQDPVLRALRVAQFPQLVAAQRERKINAAQRQSEQLTDNDPA